MERDIAYFVSWCIEEYKSVAGLGGTATMELLDKYGILQYLADNFDVLHTQSRQWLMEEITEKIASKREQTSSLDLPNESNLSKIEQHKKEESV